MKKTRTVLTLVVGAAVLLAASYQLLVWGLRRSLEKVDYATMRELLKVPLTEAVREPAATQLELGSEKPEVMKKPRGWTHAPRSEVRLRAQLWDSFVNATHVGHAAIALDPAYPLPQSSNKLATVPSPVRLDAWGRDYCLLRLVDRVAVISRGSAGSAFDSCADMHINSRELAYLSPGKLYEYPSGAIVVVVKGR